MPIPDAEGPDGNSVGGSGASMTSALRDELLKHKINVLPLEAKTLAEARSESLKLGCERMIRAKLTEWKDYATEWSGKGDSIALSAEMYDVQKMKLLSTSSFRKKASAVSFVSHSPERFETVVADNTIAKLFGLPLPGKK